MIQQFRTSNPFNILLLAVITGLLRLVYLYNLSTDITQPFGELFNRLLVPPLYHLKINSSLNVGIASVVILAQALLLNRIVNQHNLLSKQTYLPALFYVVLCSSLTVFLTLSLPLLCNFVLLYIFNKLLLSYKLTDAIAVFFDMGFIIGLATILYFPLIGLLLFIWCCQIILRPFYWREWMASIIAFLLAMFFLAVYYFHNDKLINFIDIWHPFNIPLKLFVNIRYNQYLVLLPIVAALFLGFVSLRSNFFKSFVMVRKGFLVLFLLTIIIIFSYYLSPDFAITHFIMLGIPLCVLLAYYFLYAKRKWIYESLFFIILAFILYFQIGITVFNF
jgi:hypothetical protein